MMAIASTGSAREPNIVFILADDLGWGELGSYGQTKLHTPNLDRLASQGTRFTQHYSGAPVCAPSRCVLMTGKHLGHAEIRGNKQAKIHFPEFSEGQHPIRDEAVTIAEVLKQAGYATGAFGKWGLGPVGSTGDPIRQGFDRFFGYNCQAVAHSYYPEFLWDNANRVRLNDRAIPGHRKPADGPIDANEWVGQHYAPYRMIEQALAFIEANAHRPFFLYLPCIEPHVAMHPPLETLERFPSQWDTQEYRGGNGYLPHPRPRAAYAAMIYDLDRHVGKVLDALDKHGLSDQTLVVFSSDNGATHSSNNEPDFHVGGADPKFFSSTANLRGYKGSVYEGGIRVPMIARYPGVVPAGKVQSTPSYFADWFPTLCDAAGIAKQNRSTLANCDGVSLWPVLTGTAQLENRPPMVWVFPEYTGQVAVRWGDYKLLRRGLATKKPSDWELFDLSKDPSETENLAIKYPELVDQGKRILQEESEPNEIFPVEF
jgi:arylsulfatase A-like enzyme